MTARAYWSTRPSNASPMISSGAMYSGVPRTIPAPVIAVCEGCESAEVASTFATPKSLRNE